MQTKEYFLLKSAAVRYMIWLGVRFDCSRSTYSHVEGGPCSSRVTQPEAVSSAAHLHYYKTLRRGWRRHMYHHHYQLPLFSQLPNNFSVSNRKIFSLHLLAKLTKVIVFRYKRNRIYLTSIISAWRCQTVLVPLSSPKNITLKYNL